MDDPICHARAVVKEKTQFSLAAVRGESAGNQRGLAQSVVRLPAGVDRSEI